MKTKIKSKKQLVFKAIDLRLARRVLEVIKPGLTRGIDDGNLDGEGRPHLGGMCVEAAVAYAMGEDHNDNPKCVDGDAADYKIYLNDKGDFTSDKDRSKQLRRIAVAQLGSNKMKGNFCDQLSALYNLTRAETFHAKSAIQAVILAAIVAKLEEGDSQGAVDLEYAAQDELEDIFGFEVEVGISSGNVALNQWSTKEAIAAGIEALRRCGSPGIALMDKLIKTGEL